MRWTYTRESARGFTIVELLIVIVVIALLASIAVVSYSGIQKRARIAIRQSDLQEVLKHVELYKVQNGEYPKTTDNPQSNWKAIDVRTDDNCTNGSSQQDWVPGIIDALPQSTPSTGANGEIGCYLYASNGTQYVLSAWNMLDSPQTSLLYRRLGFRQFQTDSSTQFYTCNDNVIGGANGGYNSDRDYYKHSLTLSNITTCNETPPPGA